MTEKQRLAVADYIGKIADELGLMDWEIALETEAAPDDCYAMVDSHTQRRRASIKLCRDFFSLPPETQRMAMVHELIHCHLENATNVLKVDMCKASIMTQQMYDLIWNSYYRQMELAVDGITMAIKGKFPLPIFGD